jgi:hypothetical protein
MAHPLTRYTDDVRASHDKHIRRGTYQDRGRSIGAAIGATAGLSSGLTAKKIYGTKGRRGALGVAALTGLGTAGGAMVGEAAGTLIRRKQPLKESKNFSMNTVPTARLVELNAHFDSRLNEIGFAQRKDEENSGAKTAAKVAGVGALAAGGLYARGRLARNGGKWGRTGVRGVLDADGGMGGLKGAATSVASDIKRGAGMTVNDVKGAAGALRNRLRPKAPLLLQ